MRANVDIDDKLMTEAMTAGEFRTRKETIEAGLRLFVRPRRVNRNLIELGGKWLATPDTITGQCAGAASRIVDGPRT